MSYYDSEEDRYNSYGSDQNCHHNERYYDKRDPFTKLAELVYPVPPHITSQASTRPEAISIQKTLLDSYISDSEDSYTEEELLEYAKRGQYFDTALVEKAEMGDKDACFKIGKIYQDGCLSVHKSILWYEKAAEKGHMKAQTAVGDMYINASKTRPPYSTQYHVEFDSEKGLKWYKRAFSNGNIDVAVKIGDIYRLNDGQQAMGWYVKAYQLGVVKAGEKIGDMYAYGSGVKQDYDLAKEWYIKSYEKGHMFSAIKIAGLYFETRSDESNAIAEEWIAKAYANPDSEVAFRIANLYDYHFTEDLARSLKWYYKAGLCNHQPSQKHLLELDEYTNDLSIETKREILYEHYTQELHSDVEKKAVQIKSLEEQLKAKDDTIAALQKRLTDAGL